MIKYNVPEPPLEPPEGFYVTADCGCQVYENEYIYEWNGKKLCPDCMETRLNCLPMHLIVTMLGGYPQKVERYE